MRSRASDGRLAFARLIAEIGMPSPIVRADGISEGLTMSVGAGDPAEIGAMPRAHAGEKKVHRRRRGWRLGKRHNRARGQANRAAD